MSRLCWQRCRGQNANCTTRLQLPYILGYDGASAFIRQLQVHHYQHQLTLRWSRIRCRRNTTPEQSANSRPSAWFDIGQFIPETESEVLRFRRDNNSYIIEIKRQGNGYFPIRMCVLYHHWVRAKRFQTTEVTFTVTQGHFCGATYSKGGRVDGQCKPVVSRIMCRFPFIWTSYVTVRSVGCGPVKGVRDVGGVAIVLWLSTWLNSAHLRSKKYNSKKRKYSSEQQQTGKRKQLNYTYTWNSINFLSKFFTRYHSTIFRKLAPSVDVTAVILMYSVAMLYTGSGS